VVQCTDVVMARASDLDDVFVKRQCYRGYSPENTVVAISWDNIRVPELTVLL